MKRKTVGRGLCDVVTMAKTLAVSAKKQEQVWRNVAEASEMMLEQAKAAKRKGSELEQYKLRKSLLAAIAQLDHTVAEAATFLEAARQPQPKVKRERQERQEPTLAKVYQFPG